MTLIWLTAVTPALVALLVVGGMELGQRWLRSRGDHGCTKRPRHQADSPYCGRTTSQTGATSMSKQGDFYINRRSAEKLRLRAEIERLIADAARIAAERGKGSSRGSGAAGKGDCGAVRTAKRQRRGRPREA